MDHGRHDFPAKATHPAPPPGRRSTIPQLPKMRESCHACAASKVKCHKEKPICARCRKRGVACEYILTKRAGRKKSSRASNTTDVSQAPPRSSSSTSSDINTTFISPTLIQSSPNPHTSTNPQITRNLLSHTDPAWSPTFTPEFDDFSTPPNYFAVPDTFHLEFLNQHHTDFSGVDNDLLDANSASNFFMSEDTFSPIDEAFSEFPTPSKPLTPPNSRASPTSDAQSLQKFSSEASCRCLIRALGLLEQFLAGPRACTPSKEQPNEDATRQLPAIQSVIAENEQSAEAINNMLLCECSQDEYLLTIISLIIFKVLGRYAAAAHETLDTDDNRSLNKTHPSHQQPPLGHSEQVARSPSFVGSYSGDGEDQSRMAAQLVFSQLDRVERLVNLLSQRLKDHGTRNETVNTPRSVNDDKETPLGKSSASPFSAIMLDQLDADLRKRLRAVSSDITDLLQRG